MSDLLAIAGLGAVCALWVIVQRAARRLDPHEPGVVRGCGGCTAGEHESCPRHGDCASDGAAEPPR
jgi:hypothetical protein